MTDQSTDAELDHNEEAARLDGNYMALRYIRALRSLRTRPAEPQGLTGEEREALAFLRADIREFGVAPPERQYRSREDKDEAGREWTQRCITVLDRLIGGTK